MSTFDFAAYRDAVLQLDAERWLEFYAPDAEWWEYRHANPPRAPNVMRGSDEIGQFLRGISGSGIRLALDNEVVAEPRVAYTLTVSLPDGRRIIENVILSHRDARIIHQIDVEAWD